MDFLNNYHTFAYNNALYQIALETELKFSTSNPELNYLFHLVKLKNNKWHIGTHFEIDKDVFNLTALRRMTKVCIREMSRED